MNNNSLQKAKKEKNDEFYTEFKDIEKECINYGKQFENKIIFCNCDDPAFSNFYQFFNAKFDDFKLKGLITTHYSKDKSSYSLEVNKNCKKDKITGRYIPIQMDLKGDGDFRSDESITLLKKSDIVITNPPFSLFREYIAQLIEYKKDFLIIGNVNAIQNKNVFPLIRENKVWLGVSPRNMNFKNGKTNEMETINACWYTNLKNKRQNEELHLFKKYNKNDYPKYDDYDAIEVSKIKNIPCDYDGVMGVPITFLEKHNLNQFEILDIKEPSLDLKKIRNFKNFKEFKSRQVYINQVLCQKKYHRVMIKKI